MAQGDVLSIIKNRPGNRLINGGFEIWQRALGAAISSVTGYVGPDRFRVYHGSTATHDIVRTGEVPDNSKTPFALKIIRTGAGTDNSIRVEHRIEAENIYDLKNKQGSLSFQYKIQSANGDMRVEFDTADVADDWSAYTEFLQYDFPIIADGNWHTVKLEAIDIPADVARGLQIRVSIPTPVNISDTAVIAQMMFNEGPVAAEFERAGVNNINELQLCKRYYEQILASTQAGTNGICYQATTYSVEKRTTPTVSGDGDASGTSGWSSTKQAALLYRGGYAANYFIGTTVFADAEL